MTHSKTCTVGCRLALAGSVIAIHTCSQIALAQDSPQYAGGAVQTIDETVLGPGAAGGVRPDSLVVPSSDAPSFTDRLTLTVGVDWTNSYFYRGIRQEDNGLIIQPYAALSYAAGKIGNADLTINLGTWHSFHDNRTAARADAGDFYRAWYEADYTAGLSLADGNWTFGAAYVWLDSPSDAFKQSQEVTLSVAYNDSERLGAWSMKPTLTVGIESSGGAADTQDRGIFAQLSVNPGIDIQLTEQTKLRVDMPAALALSLTDYYQDANGDDDFFGFASIGPKVSLPLISEGKWGTWTLHSSATWMFLGDNASGFNNDDDQQWIFTAGISVAF